MDHSNKLSKRVEFYLRLFYVYAAISLIIVLVSFYFNEVWGIINLIIFLVLGIITFVAYRITRKYLVNYVNDYALNLSHIQKNFIANLNLPYVLVDLDGSIRWYNKSFEGLFLEEEDIEIKLQNKNIHALIKDVHVDQLPKDDNMSFEKDIMLNNNYYVVKSKLIEVNTKSKTKKKELLVNSNHLYALWFHDITDIIHLKQENIDQQTLISIMLIDNYDEVMQSVDDVRKPLIEAMIYKKLSDMALELHGVVRKLEKDKFIVLFPNKSLRILEENKFSILDEMRKINLGNELPVTLSIGIGVGGKELSELMEFARAAIDLALGRGGDQAVIKNNDRYVFYGGKTKGVEKSTRVKARIKAYAFRELIEESDRVLIMGHINADIDAFGAAIGVYRGCKLLDKPAHIVLNSSESAVNLLYQRLLLEKDYEEDMIIDKVEAVNLSGDKTLMVVVDVNRPSYVECPELLELNKNIVVFDHHRTSVEYIQNPVISYVEPYASSTCEMITEILQYMIEKVKLKDVEADALFAGIAMDTKNFTVKTGVRTFEAAAFLRRHGADSVRVRELFKSSMYSYRAKTTIVRDAETYKGNLAISTCPVGVDEPIILSAQAADELLNIEGIRASFVLCEVDGVIMISARSFGDFNVQLIMEKLGGGGHLTVAGAQLRDESMDSAVNVLKLAIEDYLQGGN
ncbi:DHH family phosphoesterase [Vallitalea okinawensis]|uniref:DHH family phosphoesterase n=1 Tax=Vallitalea okinawensis TaxID=2078660 RepID=UPI000CFD71B0|nr:DHH family phosphoesterase [Vallitalea okinawensis]